jgi:hypothetical protein
VPTELPAIQLDAPPPAPQPAPIPAPPAADKVIFEVPVTDADNVDVANPNGNTFTPDVPNLMELPLDSITNSPPPNNQ